MYLITLYVLCAHVNESVFMNFDRGILKEAVMASSTALLQYLSCCTVSKGGGSMKLFTLGTTVT